LPATVEGRDARLDLKSFSPFCPRQSGGQPHALQTLRDCPALIGMRGASGVRTLQRRFRPRWPRTNGKYRLRPHGQNPGCFKNSVKMR